MKRSEINDAITTAMAAFNEHHWVLPPSPKWDVTDFGLGEFEKIGLTLVNLSEQPEYCEKIMYVRQKQITPMHHHKSKKEDIICRWGALVMRFDAESAAVTVQVNGEERELSADDTLVLKAGERVTLSPGVDHAFWAESDYAIVGEVSTANDDTEDNFFQDARVGRFSEIDEDEPPLVKLVSDTD